MQTGTKRTIRSITSTDKTSSIGSKKIFDPELQSFTRRAVKFDSFTNKDSSKSQKLTLDKVVEKILYALDHFYQEDITGFYLSCKDFLAKNLDSWRLKIIDRMNTYEYIQMAVKHKPFCDIETQIIKQWKKNYLLFGIMTFWYSSIQKVKFKSSKEFQQQYNIFRQFISQLSYLIFKGWLSSLEKKRKISGLDKLFDQTSHFIITESSQFKKVYEKVILSLIDYEIKFQKMNWEFDLNTLHLKKCIYSQARENNLSKSIEVLKKFSKELKLFKKIQLLKTFRQTLEQQLSQNQHELMKKHEAKYFQILEKDDFITALIYCIINGEIQDIQHSMIYMVILLGQNLQLLSKFQVNSYAIDVIAAIDYLCQNDIESELIRHHIFIDKRLKMVSTPLIKQSSDIQQPILDNLTTKHITYVDQR